MALKLKHSLHSLILSSSLITLCVFLSACSSTPEKKQRFTPTVSVKQPVTTPKKLNRTSEELYEIAINLDEQNKRSALIDAAQLAAYENKPAGYIKTILDKVDLDIIGTLDEEFILLELFLFINDEDNAEVIVKRLQQGVLPPAYQASLNIFKNQLLSSQSAHLAVLRNAYRTKSLYKNVLSPQQQYELNRQIWFHIQQVQEHTLQQFNSEFGELAGQWSRLIKLIQVHLGKPNILSEQIAVWLSEYDKIETIEWLPNEVRTLSSKTFALPSNIALLLPFSGSFEKQSRAIRTGFLANLSMYEETKVIFLDTEKLSLQEIEQHLIDNNIDFVVGPLLKSRIEEYSNSDVLKQLPTLHLNRVPPELAKPSSRYYFSLAPEDEIEQAVEYFVEQNVTYPAILFANNNLGTRLSNQFNQYWLSVTGEEAEAQSFSSRSKLGEAVKDLLNVSQSEKRINAMESLFTRNLKSEKRSRNDIDAIYIIADPQETRLIKPFFDVNLSTFGKPLPIYASSRSYVVGEGKEQKKDLNGLIFTEMPWLVHEQFDVQASATYNAVDLNNTQLKKLFAFGYDAATLLPKLQHLEVLPHIRVDGLTGKLQLNENNQIKRTLVWTQYRQGRVIEISKSDQ